MIKKFFSPRPKKSDKIGSFSALDVKTFEKILSLLSMHFFLFLDSMVQSAIMISEI